MGNTQIAASYQKKTYKIVLKKICTFIGMDNVYFHHQKRLTFQGMNEYLCFLKITKTFQGMNEYLCFLKITKTCWIYTFKRKFLNFFPNFFVKICKKKKPLVPTIQT
jgi:hypothetical protein